MKPLLFGLYVVVAVVAVVADERPVPDEPEERFTVLVLTETLADPEDPEDPEDKATRFPASKITDEVRKRIKDRKKWFLVSDRRDRAEILVEVTNHKFEERMRTRMEYRVDNTGVNKQLVDVNWTEEHHFIEARVHLPGGFQTLVEGIDTREKGGSLKGAASDLAEKLEALVKERYWELVERRKVAAGR